MEDRGRPAAQVAGRRSSRSHSSSNTHNIPEVIEERKRSSTGDFVHRRYLRGDLLGKGGFARCFHLTNIESNKVYAGKIVAKSSLTKPKAKQKLQQEIKIHKTIKHSRIVQFIHFFEDAHNAYILLELCTNQTLSELVKRRKRLTEAETQYYMLQILEGVGHLHRNGIIHRDLKLGNIFLTHALGIKIGDLGLAAKLSHMGERKRTICGTPNYIAPEVLEGKAGHSFGADIWSLGVIIYTMLIGRPPFETSDVKLTYKRIRAGLFTFPSSHPISDSARSLIQMMLQCDPARRPSVDAVMKHAFFTHPSTRIPRSLPLTSLTIPPLFGPSDFVSNQVGSGGSSRTAAADRYGTQGRENRLRSRSMEPDAARRAYQRQREPVDENYASGGSTTKLASNNKAPSARIPLGPRDMNVEEPKVAAPVSKPIPKVGSSVPRHLSNNGGSNENGVSKGSYVSNSSGPASTGNGSSTGIMNVGGVGSAIGMPGQASGSDVLGSSTATATSSAFTATGAAVRSRGERTRARERERSLEARRERGRERELEQRRRSRSLGRPEVAAVSGGERPPHVEVDAPVYGGGYAQPMSDRLQPSRGVAAARVPAPAPATSPSRPRVRRGGGTKPHTAGFARITSAPKPAPLVRQAFVETSPASMASAGSEGSNLRGQPMDVEAVVAAAVDRASTNGGGNHPAGDTPDAIGRPRSTSRGRGARRKEAVTPGAPAAGASTHGSVANRPASAGRSGEVSGGRTTPGSTRGKKKAENVAVLASTPQGRGNGAGSGSSSRASALTPSTSGLASGSLSSSKRVGRDSSAGSGSRVREASSGREGASSRSGPGSTNTLERMHRRITLSMRDKEALAQGAPTFSNSGDVASPAPAVALRSPDLWVIKWVDYTTKYGLGFLFNNHSCGVFFNDCTKIVLSVDKEHFEYLDRSSSRSSSSPPRRERHSLSNFPAALDKKVTLLKHFRDYLFEQQRKAPAPLFDTNVAPIPFAGTDAADTQLSASDKSDGNGLTFLKKWMLHKYAVIFRLSDGTVQVSFFDKTEIMLSSGAYVVTYVNKMEERSVFPLTTDMGDLQPDVAKRLRYTKDILYQLIVGSRGRDGTGGEEQS